MRLRPMALTSAKPISDNRVTRKVVAWWTLAIGAGREATRRRKITQVDSIERRAERANPSFKWRAHGKSHPSGTLTRSVKRSPLPRESSAVSVDLGSFSWIGIGCLALCVVHTENPMWSFRARLESLCGLS